MMEGIKRAIWSASKALNLCALRKTMPPGESTLNGSVMLQQIKEELGSGAA
jgi:hypothetical protein